VNRLTWANNFKVQPNQTLGMWRQLVGDVALHYAGRHGVAERQMAVHDGGRGGLMQNFKGGVRLRDAKLQAIAVVSQPADAVGVDASTNRLTYRELQERRELIKSRFDRRGVK
jgi:hypothetical protein